MPLEAPVSDAEPVLDVPAISSEVEQQQRERAKAVTAAPKKRASKPQKAAPRRKARSAPAQTPKLKRGEVGPAILAAVEAKLAEGLIASKAFEAVANERGMKTGAVSANYYRVIRKSKVVKPSRAGKRSAVRNASSKVSPRPVASPGVRSRSVATGEVTDIDSVLADLASNVQALVEAATQQGTEVAELRSQLGQIGSALGG
jgi:hypothetical protein